MFYENAALTFKTAGRLSKRISALSSSGPWTPEENAEDMAAESRGKPWTETRGAACSGPRECYRSAGSAETRVNAAKQRIRR